MPIPPSVVFAQQQIKIYRVHIPRLLTQTTKKSCRFRFPSTAMAVTDLTERDLDISRRDVWLTFGIAALAIPLSIYAIAFNCRRYAKLAENNGGTWSRFQFYMILVLSVEFVAAICSLANLLMIWQYFPERLILPIHCSGFIFDRGWQMTIITVLEMTWQILLQAGAFIYFILIMDRYSAFRMFIPGGQSPTIRMLFFLLGTFLYLLTFAQNILVNVGARSDLITLSNPQCIASIALQLGLLVYVSHLDLSIAFFLCRAVLGLDKGAGNRSWSILQRPSTNSRKSTAKSKNSRVDEHELQSVEQRTGSNAIASTSNNPLDFTVMSDSATATVGNAAPSNSTTTVPQLPPLPHRRTTLRDVFVSRHRRRVALLLIHAQLMELVMITSYTFPIFIPGLVQRTRAFHAISMLTFLMHLVTNLWFLESFKEVVLAPRSAASVGDFFSSITVDP
ncbi:hypothetical protein BJ742DRAFT_788396 [Cladochytrium replicatum]|nr:hypothetical protein BJ742DRAFT_788396 [Cladochytrium replicatum]